MVSTTKIIVSNRTALKAKYGGGLAKVDEAIKALIASDAARGIKTKLISIDDAAAMKKVKAKAVTSASDEKGAKAAIDAIFKVMAPIDYLMILGGPDIVPHITLANPAADDDQNVPSDLPYACDAAYARTVDAFLAPTRVVGRLPDGVGSTTPAYLVKLLSTATSARPRPRDDYAGYFGLTAEVWKGSTALSLDNIFGNATTMRLSPPSGPNWTAGQVVARSHFINCHGAPADPFFYGQRGENYPKAHASARLAGKVTTGTVAAAECCYGAELYNATLDGGTGGICDAYLGNGAYGFVGSTTIAYGPADDNGLADLITQYFIQAILTGASQGRAMLVARQKFLSASGPTIDKQELKTIGQFLLLGDPSVQPVAMPGAKAAARKAPAGVDTETMASAARAARRADMIAYGKGLQARIGYAKATAPAARGNVRKNIDRLARSLGLGRAAAYSANYVTGSRDFMANMKAATPNGGKRVLHTFTKRLRPGSTKVARFEVLVIQEENGRLVKYRRYSSK